MYKKEKMMYNLCFFFLIPNIDRATLIEELSFEDFNFLNKSHQGRLIFIFNEYISKRQKIIVGKIRRTVCFSWLQMSFVLGGK